MKTNKITLQTLIRR